MFLSSALSSLRSIIDPHAAAAWGGGAGSHGTGHFSGRNLMAKWRDDDLGVEGDDEVFITDVIAESGELERPNDRPRLCRLLPALQDFVEPRRLVVRFNGMADRSKALKEAKATRPSGW